MSKYNNAQEMDSDENNDVPVSPAAETPDDPAQTCVDGLEHLDENYGLPLPPGMLEAVADSEKNTEEQHIDGGNTMKAGPELVEENVGPVNPFVCESDYDDDISKKYSATLSRGQEATQPCDHPTSAAEEDPIIVPSSDRIEIGAENRIEIEWNEEELQQNTVQSIENNDENQSIPNIPEAFLVEDQAIIIAGYAEPLLPWWKQKRTRFLFLLVFLIAAAAAIAVGVSFHLNNPTSLMSITAAPSLSNTPTFQPSTYFPSANPTSIPSSSLVPSSSPSTCVYKISANAQKIDLKAELENPQDPEIAVDGRNMVIVARDSRALSSVKIIFYTLKNDLWERVNTLSEDGYYGGYSVALSGKTAFVGFPNADNDSGTMHMYEQDSFGIWNKLQDVLTPADPGDLQGDANYGESMDVDGDLACVGGWYDTFVFTRQRRDDYKWAEKNKLGGGLQCFVSGDTIAIDNWGAVLLYKYDHKLDQAVPIQERIDGYSGSTSLSHDHLAFSIPGSIIIYRRKDLNGTFIVHQQLHSSDFKVDDDYDRDHQLSLDRDMMVIGGYNNTYIYSEDDGYWQETIVLDQPYDRYQLSGRNLLVTRWDAGTTYGDVYYLSIEYCTQPMPTQMPALSMAPTNCFDIGILIVYDNMAADISWKLDRVDGSGNTIEIKTYYETDWGAVSYAERICLQQGHYEFTIYDKWGKGLCCEDGEGHYSLTSSTNGELIAFGGDFGLKETTRFSLPFILAPSAMPNSTP